MILNIHHGTPCANFVAANQVENPVHRYQDEPFEKYIAIRSIDWVASSKILISPAKGVVKFRFNLAS